MTTETSSRPPASAQYDQCRPFEPSAPITPGQVVDEPGVILLLTADTGGGHRAAAEALQQALESRHPGRLVAVTCDPLTGADANRVLGWFCLRYGPLVRVTPWLWSLLFHATNTPVSLWILQRLLTRFASAPIAAALARHQPLAVVALHPLLATPAVAALSQSSPHPALVTVVTDLGNAHRSWWHPAVEHVVTPTADLSQQSRRLAGIAPDRCKVLGIPVREQFRRGPADPDAKAALRASLGLDAARFVVLVTAGAEGGRGMKAWTLAIISGAADVDVVAVCGRNERLRANLERLAARSRGRLIVTGFVENMADWLRSADVLVTKAGPGAIAEATSCGVPMLLAGHLPGQEVGNTEIVARAGAGRPIRGRRQLRAQIEDLQSNPASLDRMRAAAVRLSRPAAAAEIADLLAEQARVHALQPSGGGSRSDRAAAGVTCPTQER
jgi:1,2-diacylglycerol 3-beta-galactosyltransferase